MLCSPCEWIRTVFSGIIAVPCYLFIMAYCLFPSVIPIDLLSQVYFNNVLRILIIVGCAFPLILSLTLFILVSSSSEAGEHKCSNFSLITDILVLGAAGFVFYAQPRYFPFWAFIILFLIKMGVTFCDPTFKFLNNIKSEEGANKYMVDVMHLPPYLTFHVEAYHYETRHRTVHYTDSNGRSHTRHETYQEKVVTLRRSENYEYKFWNDVSEPTQFAVPQFQEILKIEISNNITAADTETMNHYQREWDNFHQRYRNADVHVDFNQYKGISNLPTDSLLAFLDVNNKPEMLSVVPFVLLCITPWQSSFGLWLDRISYHEPRVFSKQFSQYQKLEPKTRVQEIEWIKQGSTGGFINSFWYNGFRTNVNETAFSPMFSDSYNNGYANSNAVVSPVIQPNVQTYQQMPIDVNNNVNVNMNMNGIYDTNNQVYAPSTNVNEAYQQEYQPGTKEDFNNYNNNMNYSQPSSNTY
eukprot:TRINITY_DN953_c0_g1_i1.p1 TRINITY_DN953_c0_g1~~TRINITY_DN953_c0_g1_i1.p1  ORF type:complete len:468 (+),score=65.94 TRINITY_DN953_c0_g1_i1:34-1437(+)